MEKLTPKIITDLITKFQKCTNEQEETDMLKDYEKNLFKAKNKKAILGIDIYKYSQYKTIPQVLIPYLFNELRKTTIKGVLEYEPFIFQNHSEQKLIDNFIDTGDGGFQILDNPLEATLFAIYFQLNLHGYNSGEPINGDCLKKLIGEIKLRYAITYDEIYKFNNNFYGVAIINNSRILAKDKLDRCLIDQNVVDWYFSELNGFQNLQVIDEEDFKDINVFLQYNQANLGKGKETASFLFNKDHKKKGGAILDTSIMHIGEVHSKNTQLSVYSGFVQTHIRLPRLEKNFKKIVSSLGSLNPDGIKD